MTRVFINRPRFDDATGYTSEWLGLAVDEARRMGHDVVDLYGAEATPERIVEVFNEFNPEVFISNGHGNASTLTSQNLEPVFVACQNDEGLAGRDVYAGSCLTAQELGPSAFEKGARSYVGYLPEFVWVIDPAAPSPLEDEVARPFMDFYLAPANELLSGRPWNMVNGAIRVGNDWLRKLNAVTTPESAMQSLYLRQDIQGIIGYGVPSPILAMNVAAPLLVAVGAILFYVSPLV